MGLRERSTELLNLALRGSVDQRRQRIKRHAWLWVLSSIALGAMPATAAPTPHAVSRFEPVSTYTVSGKVAEIVDVTADGRVLLYTDSEAQEVGAVDITNPASPIEIGVAAVPGEPTSLAVTPDGRHVLVAVHGEQDVLLVYKLYAPSEPTVIRLGGQPDCVAISPDGRYAAIAIENERDAAVNDGELPQHPPGFLSIVDLVGAPETWTIRNVDLRGIADRFTDDPEPEFVTIHPLNIAAITLQENNSVAYVYLPWGLPLGGFSAGLTSHAADLKDDDKIRFDNLLENARREPDAIVWTLKGNLITANEGDYDLDLGRAEFSGGRSFTIFRPDGRVLFDSGSALEEAVAKAGLYRDGHSDHKGVEPEGLELARYGALDFLFVGMERANSVAVYRLGSNEAKPALVQILETGSRPEGLLAIPQRGLFVTANEGDGTLSLFRAVPACR